MNTLFFFIGLFCVQISFAEDPIYISLGSTCTPAFRLTECNLRLTSFPFDWIISHFECLYGALEGDFNMFFKELMVDPTGTETIDYYGLKFHHVWHEHFFSLEHLDSVDWRSKIPLIETKQHRRIKRFKNICNSKERIVFVRYDHIDKDSAEKLRDLIVFKYPELQFFLMVVKPSEEFQDPWGLKNIKNFSIEHYDTELWKKAFKQVAFEFNSEVGTGFCSEREIESLNELIPDGL